MPESAANRTTTTAQDTLSLPGGVLFGRFGETLGGGEAVQRRGRPAVIDIRVDPPEYAPGPKNQTMYQ